MQCLHKPTLIPNIVCRPIHKCHTLTANLPWRVETRNSHKWVETYLLRRMPRRSFGLLKMILRPFGNLNYAVLLPCNARTQLLRISNARKLSLKTAKGWKSGVFSVYTSYEFLENHLYICYISCCLFVLQNAHWTRTACTHGIGILIAYELLMYRLIIIM